MALTNERRRSSGTLFRALAGVLTVVVGIAVVSCSSPTKSSSNDPNGAGAATTAVDAGAGPTSITKTFRTIEVAKGFDKASNIVSRPMRNQLWVTLRTGAVRVIEIETAWSLELGQTQRNGFRSYPNPIFDLSGDISTEGERGLLGITFSTDARTLFLSYVNKKGEFIVASWIVTDPVPPPVTVPPTTTPSPSPTPTDPGAPPTSSTTSTTRATTTTIPATTTTQTIPVLPDPIVDPASKRVLLTIPREGTTNYSGQLTLGRDGYLYIGVGDSPNGSADKTAQNPESLLGKILRIDPSGEKASSTDPYAIPPSNPFAKSGGSPQIWTIGAQNPLRFSFDRANGNMWVADAGHSQFGEIDYLPAAKGGGAGDNLGWPFKEGKEAGPSSSGTPSSLVAPIAVSPTTSRDCPIIGGFVYRGSVTELQSVYIYGDFCSGTVKGLLQRKGVVLDDKAIGPQAGTKSLVAFAEDNQGELYLVTASGSVQRLVAA
ncbi:MAG: PQQ-dependent sugar dehydrogenase [Actinobacteria bacterium]|nr:PQQ-dependent sugar dehydrogenase [Actinomycetota bacterium]